MYLDKRAKVVCESRPPLRILLVDDSWAFLGSAEHFLSMEPDLQIVGCVSSGQEAIEQVELLRPDLVLMDVAMPKMNGLTAARRIKALANGPRLVLMSVHDYPAYRAEAAAAGADGFVGKADFGRQFVPLIRRLFGRSEDVGSVPVAVPAPLPARMPGQRFHREARTLG
jgi:DNA-binding NarL/FixJ family response regulator